MVEFKCRCNSCNAELEGSVNVHRGNAYIDVDPCKDCTDQAYENGREKGKEEAE
jgi:hypothetical protein